MKLLFDENLSFRLPHRLADIYPGSTHILNAGLLGAEDQRVWDYAATEGFLLASKDTDFYQRSLLYGAPPKVLWLRIGKAPTSSIAALLRERYVTIRHFADDPTATLLPLHGAGS